MSYSHYYLVITFILQKYNRLKMKYCTNEIKKLVQIKNKEDDVTSRRGGHKMEGAWWWNEEVKEKVREKKEAFAVFINSGADGELSLIHI